MSRIPSGKSSSTIARGLVYALGVVLMAASLYIISTGCASQVTQVQEANIVRSRAAFDLRCPSQRLAIIGLGNRAYGVTGCNRRATYVVSCRFPHKVESCTAIMNTNDRR